MGAIIRNLNRNMEREKLNSADNNLTTLDAVPPGQHASRSKSC
jgi:hypothetical protein